MALFLTIFLSLSYLDWKGQRASAEVPSRFRYASPQERIAVALVKFGGRPLQVGKSPEANLNVQPAGDPGLTLALPRMLYNLRYGQALLHSAETPPTLTERLARAEQLETEIQKRYYQVVLLAVGSILASLIAGLLFFLFRYNKRLHLHRLQLIRKEQETRRLQAMIEGEEKERKRLARELHDGLGAVLATAKMQINALSDNVPAVQLSQSYAKAEHLIDEACRTVREVSHNLTPDILEQHGLEFALQYLCDSMAKAHELDACFIPYGLDTAIPEQASITVYRITQELLKNITQHADASSVIVQATIEDGWLHLIVEDDGRGFEFNHNFTGGIGLSNIRSRVAYLGGRLEVDAQLGEGSTFNIDIPVGNGGINGGARIEVIKKPL